MDHNETFTEDPVLDTDEEEEVEEDHEGEVASDSGEGDQSVGEEEVAESVADEEEEDDENEEEVEDEEEAAVESVVEANDDDGEEVLTAVVIEDEPVAAAEDEDDEEPTVEVEEEPQEKPVAKKIKSSSSGKKKKKKKRAAKVTSSAFGIKMDVRPENIEAARDARATLRDVVQSLPMPFGDIQVRSFGRIHVEPDKSGKDAKFSSAGSIFPVGFSCDRFEFSPVHGRVLKMRCTILDGKRIKELQKEKGFPVTERLADGPVFRVVWGQGIDEESDDNLGSFDPELDAPLIDYSKTSKNNPLMRPKVGMRVQVRFSKGTTYGGMITEVGDECPSTKESRRKGLPNQDITIAYDDGFSETLTYPDSDVTLVVPGTEYEIDSQGNAELLEWGGKQVTSVVANSPLEAWGSVLVKLGLIDELMLASALDAVEAARKEVLQEAKEKLEGKAKTPTKNRTDKSEDSPSSIADSPETLPVETNEAETTDDKLKEETSQIAPSPDDLEPATDEEIKLRKRLDELTAELKQVEENDYQAAVALANSRINLLGRYMCNPFQDDSSGKAQQISWLATAVRKEKARMGSTGNRKKIVTAVDLLERNDSMYNVDIETLIEGLPGSEYCNSYIFQAFRSSGSATNRAWILEAQLRQEKDDIRRMKKSRELKEKEQERESQEMERKKKRLRKEEVRDSRKRQKLEEEEEKKRQRVEERLSRLKVQVEERLLKEAAAQRDKVLTSFAKSLGKEFLRRRKAAEIVAVQNVVGTKRSSGSQALPSSQILPPSSSCFEEDAVRVWNFISTFKDFFVQRGYLNEIPSLESLQKAIDCLRGHTYSSIDSKNDAIASLTDLAIAMCQPLAASLTRILFASLIALNPTLQKDFGAAFFNEVNSVEDNAEASHSDVLVPVNKHTWRDVARQSLLADALTELGMQRHEVAHILRGYRSAGHPNSKEARRLRRAEDFNAAVLRQAIHESRGVRGKFSGNGSLTRVDIPCNPLSDPSDYRFFLHNISTCTDSSPESMKDNLENAIRSFDESKQENSARIRQELGKLLSILDGLDFSSLSKSDTKVFRKVRDGVKKLLKDLIPDKKPHIVKEDIGRLQIGLLKSLEMSSSHYKQLSHSRENYIEDALKLKENLSQEKSNEDDDDDEDDDDEDNEAANAVVVDNGDVTKNESPGVSAAEGEQEIDSAEQDLDKTNTENESILDEFFRDIPEAPELIRRCMAVLRTISNTGCAEPFLYPVDPQSNPAYYDSLVRPMCLREVGRLLRKATEDMSDTSDVPNIVAEFGRNIRLIGQNCLSYANAGPTVIAAGSELLRIFERLFLDWVLAPEHLLPPLDSLDDDKCIDSHPTDSESTVLLCDGCEGKYNIARLDPPLREIPKGDWYCPRCVQGRWWGSLDPRVGRKVEESLIGDRKGIIESCFLEYAEGNESNPSFAYKVKFDDGSEEIWNLSKIDETLSSQGDPVPPIKCLAAVAESVGYGFGVDHGIRHDLIPVPANPNVSETAAQVSLSSSVFRDTIAASGGLLVVDPRDMTAAEWLRLLVLLAMKCASSDALQALISKMETEAAEKMTGPLELVHEISDLSQILPPIEDFEAKDVHHKAKQKNIAESPRGKDTNKIIPAQAVVVEASSVEVVDEMDVDTQAVAVPLNSNIESVSTSETHNNTEMVPMDPFESANFEKKRRQKVTEDSFTAYCIKNQVRSAVASFEEDAFSPLVDSVMSSKDSPLSFASLRCHRVTCFFCGLTDVALGAPLVRVPSDNEWDQLIPHCARSRQTHLVAEIPSKETPNETKLLAVKLTIGDEIFSVPLTPSSDEAFSDSGMMEFAPRSQTGFQDELQFRSDYELPFVTGSLAAHECCAVAAHNARKDKMVQSYKEKETDWVEKEFGMECGRTLAIGRDDVGRSYWKFFSDQNSLFVCSNAETEAQRGTWHRYSDDASIASVIVSLGKHSIVKDLKRSYLGANELILNGLWSDHLLKRRFPRIAKLLADKNEPNESSGVERDDVIEVEGGFEPYNIGEKVLVESKSGHLLWDASIVAQSTRKKFDGGADVIDAYQVSYTDWSTRFTEWVAPSRVVEPNENNRLLQEELQTENASSRYGLPAELNYLVAKDFLDARERARGKDPLPDFAHIARCDPQASSDAKTLRMMKAALFAIEAALPVGCIDNRESGPWRKNFAEKWKRMVEGAEGPDILTRCTIILEDTISLEWIREDIGHLRSCLPARWKAVGEGSASALALRVLLLDRSIMYGQIDRKRFSSRKRKR